MSVKKNLGAAASLALIQVFTLPVWANESQMQNSAKQYSCEVAPNKQLRTWSPELKNKLAKCKGRSCQIVNTSPVSNG